MTDTSKPDDTGSGKQPQNGNGKAAAEFRARVLTQFIKDLSFENPQIERVLEGPLKETNLAIEVNVNARRLRPDLYEALIDFNATATDKDKQRTIYQLELVYGGMFQIENIPQQALEPFLLVNCPAMLFPFLRRMVADLTREGGFEPLWLDPIDFGQLYMQRKRAAGSTEARTA